MGGGERQWEKWRAGKRLRSVCPVRLLPLHNLWAAGADHHGSVPRAAPGAVWDRPVNWMLCSCWARKAPLPSSLRNRPATSPASYLWNLQGPRSAKNKRWKQKKGGKKEKTAGPSVAHSLGCQSFEPLASLPPYFNRHPPQPLPAILVPPPTHTLTVPTPAHIPPQCLLHYWLQCFSAPQPYAQRWGPPVTQHHTN